MVYSFYFLCVGSRRNEFNSLGGAVRSLLLFRKYACQAFLFTCSHIIFTMVYSFYFLCVGSRRNGFNSLGWREGGEFRSLLLTLFAMLKLFLSFTDDKMIQQYIVFSWRMSCVIWCTSRSKIIRVSSSLLISPPSGAKTQKKEILPYPRCGFGACLRCGWAS